MNGIGTGTFSLHLVCAILMGAMVGLERQWRQRMAGTRTNALVAAGAAAFVMCGLLLGNDLSAQGRIVSYVVSGVGFLGAGVIFKDGANVRGLNTAATIWCSAAIGALCGLGSLNLAAVLGFAVVLTNVVLRPLAYRLHPVLAAAQSRAGAVNATQPKSGRLPTSIHALRHSRRVCRVAQQWFSSR